MWFRPTRRCPGVAAGGVSVFQASTGRNPVNAVVRPYTMLLDPQQLDLAVKMQAKSYALLKWVGQGVSSGLLSFRTAHEYSTLPHAAADWIDKHYLNIPDAARVDQKDIRVVANFFST
jgi:hypothetical protein